MKWSAAQFNQVDRDQGKEWLYATGKIAVGIVGIIKIPSVLSRCLSYNLSSQLSGQTRNMIGVCHNGFLVHKKSTKGRIYDETQNKMLQKPVSKTLASVTIQESVLGA